MVVLERNTKLKSAKPTFKCPDCDKEFASQRAIGPHRNQVHGYRANPKVKVSMQKAQSGDYPCERCAFVAKWPGGLTKHVRSQHPEAGLTTKKPTPKASSGPFQCPECPRSFSALTGLGIHRRQAHGIIGSSKSSIQSRNAKRSEIVEANQNAAPKEATNGHGYIQVPAETRDDSPP